MLTVMGALPSDRTIKPILPLDNNLSSISNKKMSFTKNRSEFPLTRIPNENFCGAPGLIWLLEDQSNNGSICPL